MAEIVSGLKQHRIYVNGQLFAIVPKGEVQKVVDSLDNDTEYTVTIKSEDNAGNISNESQVGFKTLSTTPHVTFKELKAFPTAFGAGRSTTTGGRGGVVKWVKDSHVNGGSESLAEIMSGDEPTTIMFAVGGTLYLDGNAWVEGANKTFAGQTAKDIGGVYIESDHVETHKLVTGANSIVRYMGTQGARGLDAEGKGDPLFFSEGDHQVWDHVSDFGSEQGIGPMNSGDCNLQFSLQVSNNSAHDVGFASNMADRSDAKSISYLYNFGFMRDHRLPTFQGKIGQEGLSLGNFAYGWGVFHMNSYGGMKSDAIGNIAQESRSNGWGSHSTKDLFAIEPVSQWGGLGSYHLKSNFHLKNDGGTKFEPVNSTEHIRFVGQGDYTQSDLDNLYRTEPIIPYSDMLSQGVVPFIEFSDWQKTKLFTIANSGAGTRYSSSGVTNVNTDEARVSEYALNSSETDDLGANISYSTIPVQTLTVTPYMEIHGFPEEWATKHGLGSSDNVHNESKIEWQDLDGYNVTNEAGYTNLEMYLHELSGEVHLMSILGKTIL